MIAMMLDLIDCMCSRVVYPEISRPRFDIGSGENWCGFCLHSGPCWFAPNLSQIHAIIWTRFYALRWPSKNSRERTKRMVRP